MLRIPPEVQTPRGASELKLSAELKHHYDHYYDGESEWRRLGAIDKAKNVIRACEMTPHRRVLDIGAGDGALVNELGSRGFAEEYYALEVSESAVEIMRRKGLPDLKEATLFDGYTIPYEDFRFDLAIMSHVLEHVEHPRLLLKEAGRVAQHVFVEVPLEDTLRSPSNFHFTHTGHINFYSYKGIRRLVQSTGFEIVRQGVVNPSFETLKFRTGRKSLITYPIREGFLRFAPRIARSLFVYHCYLLARRISGSERASNDADLSG